MFTISGVVTNRSSVFSVTNHKRISFLELHSDGEIHTVLIPHVGNHKVFSESRSSSCIQLSDLKKVKLFKNTEKETEVYQVRKTSKLTVLGDLEQKNIPKKLKKDNLVSYKGVVTKIVDSDAKVYLVDKKILLFASFLTFDQDVQLGDSVSLLNFHLLNYKDKKSLVMCGRSSVIINAGEETKKSSKDQLIKSANPLLKLLAEYSLTSDDFFQLCDNYERLKTRFYEGYNRRRLLQFTLKDVVEDDLQKRSLLQEFLDHDNSCGYSDSSSEISVHRLSSIEEALSLAATELVEYGEESCDEQSPIELDIQLFGKLIFRGDKMFMSDENLEIQVIMNRETVHNFDMLNVRSPLICRDENSDNVYAILPEVCVVSSTSDKLENRRFQVRHSVEVVSSSRILMQGQNSFFVLEIQEDNLDRRFLLMTSTELYHKSRRGCRLVFNKDDPFQVSNKLKNTVIFRQLFEDFGCEELYQISKSADFQIKNPDEPLEPRCTSLGSLNSSVEGEIVDIQGVILERRREDVESTLIISLTDNQQSINIYLKSIRVSGLIVGTEWRIENLKTSKSKKNNFYLVGTALTNFVFLGLNKEQTLQDKWNSQRLLGTVNELLSGTLCAAPIVFSILEILRLSFRADCGACGSPIEKGKCSYVGCYAPLDCNISGSGCFQVQDGSGSAVLVSTNPSQIYSILNLSSVEVEKLKDKIFGVGVLNFSKWGREKSDSELVDLVTTALSKFYMVQARVRRYTSETETKLFCTDVLDSSACLLNSLFELSIENFPSSCANDTGNFPT